MVKFPDLKPDDRVTYNPAFIRSTQAHAIKGRTGTIKKVEPLRSGDRINNLHIKLVWDDTPHELSGALASNLKKIKE